MLDIATLDEQLSKDAIQRAIALYALFENIEILEARHSAHAVVISRTQTGSLSNREVTVSVAWSGPRSFLIWDYPHDALMTLSRQEVAA
jgi:hypothetical protein